MPRIKNALFLDNVGKTKKANVRIVKKVYRKTK